ncbi:MAG TPA: AAA family ATPase [Prevotella sp.]|nr:AAA family ATPase [Candidatus Segatella violae]
MLNRKIYNYLRNFFSKEKKAILISGARQVGKTYAIRKIGNECFDTVVEINFLSEPKFKEAFSSPSSAKNILLRLSALAGKALIPGKTLIFFDEVQECPEIITAIKFLVDDGSYRYAMSGSLLGVEMKDIRSIPVGYMTEKEMFPLDFEEFSEAVGMSKQVMAHVKDCYTHRKPVDPTIHDKFNDLVRLYLVIGGMPEAVQKYIDTNNIQLVQDAQLEIMRFYGKDISKYDPKNKLYIKDIFELIPSELNAKNKRFILKALNEKAKFERYKNSFLWLADAGVALPTYNVEEPRLPLKLGEQRNLFKLFLCDVGLLASQYAKDIAIDLLTGKTDINYGAIYENFAAQELRAHGYNLYYFNNKKQGELDFVIEDRGKVLPIEIKSGKDYKRHNALSNVMSNDEYEIPSAIVFSNSNLEVEGKILYCPIYMLMYLQPTTISAPIFKFTPI